MKDNELRSYKQIESKEMILYLLHRNVVPSLNELDGLIEDAKKRKTKAEDDADGQPIQTPVP